MPTIVELAVPHLVPAVPGWAVRGWADVSRAALVEVLGHDDFADPPAASLAAYANQKHTRKAVLLALSGPAGAGGTVPAAADDPGDAAAGDPADVLGYARLDLPLDDNRHLAWIEIAVRAAVRRQGVATALWAAAEERVRRAGRDVVTAWTVHGSERPADGDVVRAPTGAGEVRRRDPAASFALARGFALEQVERHSTLALPVAGDRLAAWRSGAQAQAGPDYRIVQWVDRTPDRWVTASAELQRRMSVDVPLAGLDVHEEVWDEARVRDADVARARAGSRYVLSAVEHLATGSLVAFTQIDLPQDRPTVALQDNTLVHGDHRGRRLGLLVKAANLELLARVQPEVRRLHTWNAAENRHMLAINELMGFRTAGTEGSWQLRLT
ncbi:GNAT family N-acetyltransferase [Georgenia sp. 10Sc9-8]|uniref:GNAT family N-acetyltransferase n=1 Tax=Georgenia halotolerans TaxID=3028317 RepID=A0ABT5U1V6_9MICO|nr:GNAT family N-acetyltransferase [Georgenia halotolerans]